jgi:hypothetical protein
MHQISWHNTVKTRHMAITPRDGLNQLNIAVSSLRLILRSRVSLNPHQKYLTTRRR